MATNSNLAMAGDVTVTHNRMPMVSWRWRLRNALRWTFIWGLICNTLAKGFTALTGVPTITSELSLRKRNLDGTWTNYGVVSRRLVTNAGVAFLVDDWDNNGQDITTLNFHGCGTGATAEAAADTALVTESTTVLNPDSTRATGTRAQPSANVYRSTGVVNFDGSAAITEHGLFSQAATGGGTLWDRSVFSAVNVVSGESITFQYDCTIAAGS
jgi:hypothetical protein